VRYLGIHSQWRRSRKVINGGFGMVLDGSKEALKTHNPCFWDVNNGISRRSWARNEGALFAIKRAMEAEPIKGYYSYYRSR
jgi:urocanate hydratase